MAGASLPLQMQKLFEVTKPVCFGRLVISVPSETEVVFGPQAFGPRIETVENGAKRAQFLAEEKRKLVLENINHGATINKLRTGPTPGSVVLAFWEDASAKTVGLEELWGYLPAGRDLLIYRNATAPSEGRTRDVVLEQLNYVARNLRSRLPSEIPPEPGVCLDLGFIADDSGKFQEIFGIGFRFPSLPDVSFSVLTNKDGQTPPPLSQQRREAEQAVRGTPLEADYRKVKVLREGKRKVGPWAGEEVLFRRPPEQGGYHEFQFDYPGIRYDRNNPSIDVSMTSGVKDNRVGAAPVGLTDDEAIALWDRLLGSLRLRVQP